MTDYNRYTYAEIIQVVIDASTLTATFLWLGQVQHVQTFDSWDSLITTVFHFTPKHVTVKVRA